MTLLSAWLIAPVVLAGLTLGMGLLIERGAGYRLPGALLPGVGFAGMVCVSQLLVRVTPLAPATPWVLLAMAVAGLVLARRRIRMPDRSVLWLAGIVFVVFAAPTVLTGHATFLGYTNEGDAGFHFILAERLISHGYDLSDLPYSSYRATAYNYYSSSYPTGAHTVLGSWQRLVPIDVAWLLQPFNTFLVVISALGLQTLVAPYAQPRRLAAVVAGLSVCSGLVFVYANNQQALKEMAALACIITAAGVVPPLLRAPIGWRAGLPAAVATGGGLGVLSLALAPWIGPLLLAAAVVLAVRHRRRWPTVALEMGAFVVAAVVLSLPTLTRLGTFVQVSNGSLTGAQEFGNLLRPLRFDQAFGVWPADDFRLDLLLNNRLAPIMVGATVLAALLGLVLTVRRRAWAVLLFVAVSLIGFTYISGRASPWAYGKALVLLSPALLLMAGMAVVGLWEARRRAEGAVLLAVLIGGVGWTDALSYHASTAAPTDRLEELSEIGDRFAGRGTAMYFEFEEFAKYFLRRIDASGPAEPFRQSAEYAPGKHFAFGVSTDPDDFTAASLKRFRLLVLRQGPATSRPGTGWKRVFHGDYYDVWQRTAGPRVVARLPLGSALDAGAVPSCARLEALARQVPGGRLAAASRPKASVFRTITAVPIPFLWGPREPDSLNTRGQGRVTGTVRTGGGRFTVWVGGNLARVAEVSVDGRVVGTIGPERNQLPSQYRVADVDLQAGRHEVGVFIRGGSLRPGDAPIDQVLGPVTVVPAQAGEPVRYTPASRWRTLCGTRLDWVEAVR